jgi:hypothetical protein
MVDSRIGAVGATVIIGLIVITPFCGLLFDCGCSWPWTGLESNCNFYKESAAYRCPWCEYLVVGLGSTLLAVFSGVLAALLGLGRDGQVAMRTLEGVAVFLIAGILLGWLTAIFTGYPTFLLCSSAPIRCL